MRVLAAGLALMAHTFAMGALCLCSPETMTPRETVGAAMSCHQTAHGVSLSSLEDCCCDSHASEGSAGLVVTRTHDEISLSASQQLSMSIPAMAALRPVLPSASCRGAMRPRPPLRV